MTRVLENHPINVFQQEAKTAMTKTLSKILFSLTVTPFLMFATPAILASNAHADSEISTDVESDGGSWTGEEGDGGSGSSGGDSGWGGGDEWDDDSSEAVSGDGCSDDLAVSRC